MCSQVCSDKQCLGSIEVTGSTGPALRILLQETGPFPVANRIVYSHLIKFLMSAVRYCLTPITMLLDPLRMCELLLEMQI